MSGQAIPAISNRVKVGAPLAVLAFSLVFPRLSLLQTVLLTPAFLAIGGVAIVFAIVTAGIRRESVTDEPPVSQRQRHALRRFTFTTSSAWSAVLTRQHWEDSPSPTWRNPVRQLTARPTTVRLDVLFDLIKAHFIVPWYARISPSRAFPDAVEVLIRQSLSRTVQRGEQVDWPNVLISRMVPLLTEHLNHYRTIEHLSSTSAASKPHTSLPLPLPQKPHPALVNSAHGNALASSPTVEAHLRGLVKRMLDHILPDHEKTEVVGTIATEVVLGTVLLPVFDMLSDGDFWNRQIDERGGRYLHEQKQVNRFLSALSTLQQPLAAPAPVSRPIPSGPRSLPPASSISIHSSSKHFDQFLRSISKLKALGEARRLRADVERELRNILMVDVEPTNEKETRSKRKYVQRLERARSSIDERILVLSGENSKNTTPMSPDLSHSITPPTGVDLYSVLSDPSSMAYFLEFMERRSRSRLVQFWLTIEGFKDPLEAAGRFTAIENTSSAALRPTNDSEAAIIAEDVSFLYLAYFAEHDEINNLGVPQKYQKIFKDFAQRADYDRSGQSVTEVKLAMFSAQDAAYAQMEEDDWPGFRKTELHRKALANLEKVSAPKPPAFPPPPQRSSSSAITIPPPHPARQNTAPALLAGLTSPSQRAAPRLINGNFAPSAAKLESAISIAPPRFERVTSSGSQESDSGHHHLFKASLDGDSPHMKPSLTRGSSHFDVLMSASQQKERDPLFEDDGDEGLQDNDALENQRMEAIQAALNEIIATDDMTASRMSLTNPMTPGAEEMRSPSASMISLGPRTTVIHPRLASKSVEDLKSPKDLGASGVLAKKAQMDDGPKVTERKSMSSLSPVEKRPSRVLFDDDVLDEDEADDGTEATDKEGIPGAMVRLAEPGNLQLGPEIARLQDRIQELIKQGRVLETLISQAELTGNQAELRLLRRSQSAVRQETRACIFQKAQYDQQEEENRLVPGRTRLSVPSHIDTLDEGKQVVRYVVRIDQVDDEGQTLLSWNVARRYNEFHDLDKGVRDWAIATGDKQILGAVKRQIAELPGKKLVPVLSSQQLDARRSGLERYLKSLIAISALCASPPLRTFLSREASRSPTMTTDPTTSTASLTNLAPHNLVKSLYKTMATSLDDAMLGPSMLDLMYTSLGRQISDVSGLVGVGGDDLMDMLPQALKSGWANPTTATSTTAGPVTGDGDETAVSIFTAPICDLFVELFDLKENKNNWLRRQAIVVILQQLLGSTIERKVRDTFRSSLQPDSIEKVLLSFQELLFPDGDRRPPSDPRIDSEKHDTKVRASKKVGLLIPDVAANMIGRSNARRGARRVFGALQDQRLNQQLVLCMFDEIFDVLFPPLS